MSYLAHIADRCLNRPLLITPDKAEVIMSVLGGRIGLAPDALVPEASRFVGEYVEGDDPGTGKRTVVPYRQTPDGVGIMTITGSLVNRGAWIGASSGLTSYEGIQHQLRTAKAAADAGKLKALILDMHTPGGEAVGAFETAGYVREVAAKIPVVAVVNGMMASAGYAIGSGASEIVTTETGVAGSIGVVLLHADFSRALANEGIKPTLIFAGAHKVDGNPYEPLPDAVRADLQAEVDAFYESFLQTVARGRGKRMTAAGARKTQARTFIGQAAVDAGLADRVASFDQVLADLSRAPSGRTIAQPKRTSMSETSGAPAAEAGISKAEHEAAVKAARAEGETIGAKAATDRFSAIVNAEPVKGSAARIVAAFDLATKAPGMAAADVVGFVSANVQGGQAALTVEQRAMAAQELGASNGAGQTTKAEQLDAMWASAIKGINAGAATAARK